MSDNETSDRYRQPHDYDVDDRWAHIRVEVLGQEFTDVVRVCEQFPDLPDGITVYVEHVDAVDLRKNNSSNRPVDHLVCTVCGDNPSYALIDGEGFLVCHCTHVGRSMDPWPVHGFHGHPEEWEFVQESFGRGCGAGSECDHENSFEIGGGVDTTGHFRILKCRDCRTRFERYLDTGIDREEGSDHD